MSIITLVFVYKGGAANVAQAAQATKSFNYTCVADTSVAGQINIDMKVTPTLTLPDSVQQNGEIAITDSSAKIEVDLTGNLDGLRALINPFKGQVNHFNIKANDSTVNLVGSGAAIPETPHQPDATAIPFTVSGVNTAVTAGDNDTEIKVGEIEAVINAKLGAIPVDLVVSCTPPADNVLAAVSVQNEPETPEADGPEITLIGANPMELEVGETYSEPGATAQDAAGTDLTDQINITGDPDTNTPGTYEIKYTVADVAGNQTQMTRTVIVNAPPVTGEPDDEGPVDVPDEDDTPEPDSGDDNQQPQDNENPPATDDEDNDDDTGPVNDENSGDSNATDTGKNNLTGNTLPKTATNHPLMLIIGFILTAAGGTTWFMRRKITG